MRLNTHAPYQVDPYPTVVNQYLPSIPEMPQLPLPLQGLTKPSSIIVVPTQCCFRPNNLFL